MKKVIVLLFLLFVVVMFTSCPGESNPVECRVTFKGPDGTVIKSVLAEKLVLADFTPAANLCPEGKQFAHWYDEETEQKVRVEDAASLANYVKTVKGNVTLVTKYATTGTVITLWHLDTGAEYEAAWRQICDNFEYWFPGVTVNITCIDYGQYSQSRREAFAAGTPPDICRDWGTTEFVEAAEAGMLKDISAYVKKGTISKMGKGAMGLFSWDGKVYGAPYSLGAVALWYNKDVLKDCGLTPSDFNTWSKFLASCNKIKEKGYAPIALGEGESWTGFYWWSYLSQRIGGKQELLDAYTGDNGGAFNTGAFVTAMDMLSDLNEAGLFQENFMSCSMPASCQLVGSGNAAMTLNGQWTSVYAQNTDLGLMPFPAVENGVDSINNVLGSGDGYIISKNAPEETIDLLKSLYDPESYKIILETLNGMPLFHEYDKYVNNYFAETCALVRNADYFQLFWDDYLSVEIGEEMKTQIKNTFAGTKTPQAACDEIQQSWEEERN